MQENEMEFEIQIAGNDRKGKVHEPLPKISCFGVFYNGHHIACMNGHYTNTVMAFFVEPDCYERDVVVTVFVQCM